MLSGFLENHGQFPAEEIRFYATLGPSWIGFAANGIWLWLTDSRSADTTGEAGLAVVKVGFEGANIVPPAGRGELEHRSLFLLGSDPAQWRSGVRSYRQIIYPDLYDGIDLLYKATDEGLKYEFLVRPGSDPDKILLSYEGAKGVRLEPAGGLTVDTAAGTIHEEAPVAFQGNEAVSCPFALRDLSVRFRCTGWDRARTLVIDPLLYGTFIGGSSDDGVGSFAVDPAGNALVTGCTVSADFPTIPGSYDVTPNGQLDVFISKLNPTGTSLVYSTFLGGTGDDCAYAVTADAAGNLYVAGFTSSTDFPTTAGAFDISYAGPRDAFVAKLDALGTGLQYSTFLGDMGQDWVNGIAVDSAGDAYVTGYTDSGSFPVTLGSFDQVYNGNGDPFVVKLNAAGAALVYGTYLGGGLFDVASSIALDSSGSAFLTGFTQSANFPTTAGAYDTSLNGGADGFVVKLDPTGAGLTYGTFLGGSGGDDGSSVAVDGTGTAYVAGGTSSTDFPTSPGAFQSALRGGGDAFVARVDATGGGLLYSTYLGGTSVEFSRALAVDTSGNAYVTGITYATDFPVTPDAFDGANTDGNDTFVAKLDIGGTTLLYGTYLGGLGGEDPQGLALDPDGNIYVGGHTWASDFPVTSGAFDTSYNGGGVWGGDAFVAYLNLTGAPQYPVTLDTSPTGLDLLLDGISHTAPYVFWCPAGSPHTVQVPTPQVGNATIRYVFAEWSDGTFSNPLTFTCNGPLTFTANFRTEYQLVFDTSPPGRTLVVDGVSVAPPVILWCPEGSVYLVEAQSPQGGPDSRWRFLGWSDGNVSSPRIIFCDGPGTYRALFVLEHRLDLDTLPSGYVVAVDGVSHTTPHATWCDQGASVSLDVPSPQGTADSRGVFLSWSDGGASARTVACDGPVALTASFLVEHRLSLSTDPMGLEIDVDGVVSASPIEVWRPAGSVLRIAVPSPQPDGTDVRQVFDAWTDGGPKDREVVLDGPLTLAATFRTQFLLIVETAYGVASCDVPDCWYDAGAIAQLTLSPTEVSEGGRRYGFVGWTGDFAGGTPNASVLMDGPKRVVAQWDERVFAGGTPWTPILYASAAAGVAAVGAGLLMSEPLRVAAFALMAVLYTRLRREEVLDHEKRGMIRGYLAANPGANWASIRGDLGLATGTLVYHLRVLEDEGIVRSWRDGRFKRFALADHPLAEMQPKLTDVELILLQNLRDHPGMTQRDLGRASGLAQPTISYHMKKLSGLGFVNETRQGLWKHYFAEVPMGRPDEGGAEGGPGAG